MRPIDVAFSNTHVCNVKTVCGLNVQSKPNRIFLSCLSCAVKLEVMFSRLVIDLNYNINSMQIFYDA